MLRIVAATRQDLLSFPRDTYLGAALNRMSARTDLLADVAYSNSLGLPEVYNAALDRAEDSDIVVFSHDDVWLDDWYLPERLQEALARFAVVGVAGNRRRVPRQPAWAFVDEHFTWDVPENLSGAVAHPQGSGTQVSYYGECPAAVKLLDGVLLATKAETLRRAGLRFDTRFSFHFYDLDFARACEQAGLSLGTWPIAITHGSRGSFRTAQWDRAYAEYLSKWKE